MSILDTFALTNRKALVTGSASGIGQSIALALAQAGADVAIADLNPAGADETCEQIEALGRRTLAIIADVTAKDQVENAVDTVLTSWHQLDIAINSAGIAIRGQIEEISEADWDKVLDIDLKAVFLCCQAEGRAMLQRESGSIINIVSISSHIVNRPQLHGHYNTAKAGACQLTRVCAAEWAGRGVRVNSISHGHTLTPMTAHAADEMKAAWLANTPMGRLGAPADYQGAAVFLASDASAYMTGHDLVIDGGYTLW
jgi:NAD(P)-dependent dehydrogenase (short-subunit alcohol dehydrogenase family)